MSDNYPEYSPVIVPMGKPFQRQPLDDFSGADLERYLWRLFRHQDYSNFAHEFTVGGWVIFRLLPGMVDPLWFNYGASYTISWDRVDFGPYFASEYYMLRFISIPSIMSHYRYQAFVKLLVEMARFPAIVPRVKADLRAHKKLDYRHFPSWIYEANLVVSNLQPQ